MSIDVAPTARRIQPYVTRLARAAISAAVAALAAACGGSDGSGPSSRVAAPGGSPTVPSGPFGLTQLSEFPTLGFAYRYTTYPDGSRPVQGELTPNPTEVIAFSYSAASQSYEIGIPGFERGRLTPWLGDDFGTVHVVSLSPDRRFHVSLLRPGGIPDLPLESTSWGSWHESHAGSAFPPPGPVSSMDGVFAYGVPTAAGDVPTAGIRTYRIYASGRTSASLGVGYIGGTADVTFDLSTGTLTGSLNLAYADNGFGSYPIGGFPFTAPRYSVGSTGFSGKFSVPGGATEGSFEAQFTGPHASELMMRWLLPWLDPDTRAHGYLFGVLIGKARSE